MKSVNNELVVIQYLRAIAVLLVVYHHVISQFSWIHKLIPGDFGGFGVDIFFVISGLIMVYTTHQRGTTPSQFMWRRIIRIVPLYWFYTLMLVLIALITPNILKSTQVETQHIIQSLFFIPHLSPNFPNQFWPILIPGWTLNYEMYFYVLFAISLWLPNTLRLIALSLMMFIITSLSFWYPTESKSLLGFYSDTIIIEFLCGSLIGWLLINNKLPNNAKMAFLILSLFTLSFFILPDLVAHNRFTNAGIPAALLVLGVLILPNLKNDIKLLHIIGDASYSIYLSHVFALGGVRFIWNWTNQNILNLGENFIAALIFISIGFIASTILGLISFKLIESPLIKKLSALK